MKEDDVIHVVQFNEETALFLTVYVGTPEDIQWGSLQSAITFETLPDAERVAAMIGGGTVGTTKPKP